MYPLTLIKFSKNKLVTISLKDGQRVSGILLQCDMAMNMHLLNVTIHKLNGDCLTTKQCLLRGQSLKIVKIDTKILQKQYLFDK